MHELKVVREPGIRRVVAQGLLETVRRRTPLGDEPPDRHAITGDDDGLAMLDGVKDIGEGPRGLRGSHCNHEYILSD